MKICDCRRFKIDKYITIIVCTLTLVSDLCLYFNQFLSYSCIGDITFQISRLHATRIKRSRVFNKNKKIGKRGRLETRLMKYNLCRMFWRLHKIIPSIDTCFTIRIQRRFLIPFCAKIWKAAFLPFLVHPHQTNCRHWWLLLPNPCWPCNRCWWQSRGCLKMDWCLGVQWWRLRALRGQDDKLYNR